MENEMVANDMVANEMGANEIGANDIEDNMEQSITNMVDILDNIKTEIKDIQQEHKKQGHMPYFCNMARNYLVKNVLNNMKDQKLARKINGCL